MSYISEEWLYQYDTVTFLFLHIHTEPCPYFVGLLHTLNNLTEVKTRSIQIHDLSPTNLDELSTHAPPSRRPVLISLRLISGPHPAPQGSGLTVQDPDGHPDPEFNFSEIKSRSLMEILLPVHH